MHHEKRGKPPWNVFPAQTLQSDEMFVNGLL